MKFLLEQQKIVLKVLSMSDEKTKKKAIEAVAEIYGKNFHFFFVTVLIIRRKMPYLKVNCCHFFIFENRTHINTMVFTEVSTLACSIFFKLKF